MENRATECYEHQILGSIIVEKIVGIKKIYTLKISGNEHRYGPFFRCDQEDETDRQEVPQEGWLAGEGAVGVEYVLILR